jgi:hypothetical protein
MRPTHSDPDNTDHKLERREPGKRRTHRDRERPDREAVADVNEAKEHAEAHEAEQGDEDVESGAHPDDAAHGYTQDSGYAQSGGARKQRDRNA